MVQAAAPLATSVGGVFMTIFFVLVIIGVIVAKVNAFNSSKCMHCGYDSGIKASSAPICQKCGRNRTVLNTRKARKR